MKIVIKKIDQSWAIEWQRFVDSVVTINKNLWDISSAQFSIPVWLSFGAFDRIKIFEVLNEDIEVFDWFVYNESTSIRVPDTEKNVFLRERKALFDNKVVLSPLSEQTKPIKERFEAALWPYVSTYWEQWVVSTSITKSLSTEMKSRDNLFDFFDSLCDEIGVYWTVVWNEIIISDILWVDRTQDNSQYIGIYYNWKAVNNTVKSIEVINQATKANLVYWYNDNFTAVAVWVSWWEQVLVSTKQFRNCSMVALQEKTDNYLLEKNQPQQIIDVLLDDAAKLYNWTATEEAEVWDKIQLRVENVDWIIDQDIELLVIETSTIYDQADRTRVYKLWKNTLKQFNTNDILVRLQKQQRLQQL